MKYDEFVKKVHFLPVVEPELILAGSPDPMPLKVQISRWAKSGKLIQLRRGVYALGEAYRSVDIYEPYIASILKKPSYISLEKALEHHGIIPEGVKVYTSITTKRARKFTTKLGIFNYRHIRKSLFWGYEAVTVNKQTAFFATPEKALLDIAYIKGIKMTPGYLDELRLQNTGKIDLKKLLLYGRRFGKPGMRRAARNIKKYIESYSKGEKAL